MNERSSTRTVAVALLLLAAASGTACGSSTDNPEPAAEPAPAHETASGTVDTGTDEDDDELPAATVTTPQSSAPGMPPETPLAPETPPAPETPLVPATPAAPGATAAVTDLDADGVQMLLPSATGSSFRLGTSNPNSTSGFAIENNVAAQPHTLGSLTYWRTQAFNLNYSAGGTGKTTRLHMIPNAGAQKYTWKTQSGFLLGANDVKNQEVTVYVRVHDIFDASRAAVSLKIRGGRHSQATGDQSSCTLMRLQASTANGTSTMFGKELTHPNYDYVKLTPHFATSLKDGQWVGMKLVSYAKTSDPQKVVNQLYVDTTPFDADGKPKNSWQLLSEYVDIEGKSTGNYSKLADWGGSQTTIRTDGVSTVDFALVSVREVTPPPS